MRLTLPKLTLPGRRLQFGASATIALVAGAALLLSVNYLSARHFRRWDWTSSRLYTLSDKTKQILQDVTRKHEEVKITALLSPTQELYDSVRELLANYSAACPALKVEFLDSAREPTRAAALVKKFGLQSEQELRFVLFESGSRSKQVDVTEFVEYDYSSPAMGGPPRIKAFKGEQAFTGAILSVTQSSQSAVYFMKGHGEAAAQDQGPRGLSHLTDILKSENYRIAEWDSLSGGQVPDDCAALVIAGPRRTLLESEAQAIGAYLERGGRLLALLDPELGRDGTIQPTGLEGMLRDHGVTLDADLVVDHRDPKIIVLGAGPETLVVRDLPSHPVTRNLGGDAAVIFQIARSVTPVSPPPANLSVQPIARTSPDGWGERDLSTLRTGITKGPNDISGPVTVALAAEETGEAPKQAGGKKTAGGTQTRTQPTAPPPAAQAVANPPKPPKPKARLVVFGDSDFATNSASMRLGNLDLALNAIHWLSEKETLLGIEPRTPEQIVLTLSPSESRNLVLLVLFGLPMAAAVAGLTVWWQRRS